ncbi:uncharacterized protein LOC111073415 [Drosophila obscura]|uniref:uncharacterized protein LOC111073415 n=1 Tax=Drosophila obscura TaxID=7282 RepID=UPI001BB1D82C|nr:uncharacterized protein LOC111073415 [Drosophila obscura]
MSSSNILELYDDCLNYIFDLLPTQDRISFAQVCTRFRHIFVSQCGSRYREYTLDDNSSREQLIEFCTCREVVQTFTIDLDLFDNTINTIAPTTHYDILLSALKGMHQLEYLTVKQVKILVTIIDRPFDQILSAVRQLEGLRRLEIQAIFDCSVERLSELQHLEELHLHIPQIASPTLVKCCKSNSSLRSLHLGYGCVQRNLCDIVPHCKNLEVFKFGMTAESSAYRALARLPKLRQLTHFGIRRADSFEPLLSSLADRPQLLHLDIDGGSISLAETRQLIRLQSLVHLKCFCSTVQCVAMLARLSQLEELCLWMSSPLDVSDALLGIVASCGRLKLLRLAVGNVNKDFFSKATELSRSKKIAMGAIQEPPLKLEIPMACQKQTIAAENFSIERELNTWTTF